MFKPLQTLGALGHAAPLALSIAIMAPGVQAQDETYWYASGDPAVPDGQLWVNSYGECWGSQDGPTNLPPCVAEVVPPEVTVKVNFEFDKYVVPDNVVNREVVSEIDDYIARVQATPEREVVTVVGHTDAKGSDEYNMSLGQRRADAVRSYMIAQGYPAENLAPADSRGESELLPEFDPFSVEQRRVVLTKSDM